VTPIPTQVVASTEATVGPTPISSPVPPPTLGGDIDLVSLMPADIGGHKMTIELGGGDQFLGLWNNAQVAQALLTRLGSSASDVSIANSYADDVVYPQAILIYGYRVAGADGNALLQGMVQNYINMLDTMVATPTTMGGKSVTAVGLPGATATDLQYFYAVGDIVFNVNATSQEWIQEALSRLP
jgi:hypothetical protein